MQIIVTSKAITILIIIKIKTMQINNDDKDSINKIVIIETVATSTIAMSMQECS